MSFSKLEGVALEKFREMKKRFESQYGAPTRSSSGSVAWDLKGGKIIFIFTITDTFGFAYHENHEVDRDDGPASRLYDKTGNLIKEVWCHTGYYKGNSLPSFIKPEDIENPITRQATWEKLKVYQEEQDRKEKIEGALELMNRSIKVLYGELNTMAVRELFEKQLDSVTKAN
jgi:hypothetical protein